MKFEIIATGDPHLAMGVQTPIGRHPETFGKEQEDKLDFIGTYAVENKVSALVFPGDVLNYKNPSLYTAASINRIMSHLSILNARVPIHSLAGNHDLKMSSRQMKPDSVYNIFTQGKALTDIHNKTLTLATDEKGVKVTLSGLDYNSDTEDFLRELTELDATLSPNDINIITVHEHLVPVGESLPFCHFINYDRFLEFSNFNVVISGHLHKGFPTVQLGEAIDLEDDDLDSESTRPRKKITFVNPWSLTRLSRDNYAVNDEHKPELVHLTIDTSTREIGFKHVEIPHLPFEDAFIKQSLCSAESRNLDISEFVSSLRDFSGGVDSETTIKSAPEQIKERIHHYMDLANVN
jgi:predicted phosphodiesterase